MRILLHTDPAYDRTRHYHEASPWKPRWVAHPQAPSGDLHEAPFLAEYTLDVVLETPRTVRLHVSADERYRLFLDSRPMGRGPERGDPARWHFETFDVPLSAGAHRFSALVWSLGRHRPYAQMSVRHGLLVMADDAGDHAAFSTGIALWKSARIDAYEPIPVSLPGAFVATGCRFRISAAALNAARDYVAVADVGPAVPASARMESPGQWQLAPATLPAMLEEELLVGRVRHVDECAPDSDAPISPTTPTAPATPDGGSTPDVDPDDLRQTHSALESWQDLLVGEAPVTIPPNSNRRVLIDLGNYHCLYPRLIVSGGSGGRIRLHTAEALFSEDRRTKHQRDRIDGLYFSGLGDDYLPDGSPEQRFEPPWWLAGRYVMLSVSTAGQPLKLHALSYIHTHYPYHWDTSIRTSDARIDALIPVALRSLEMCSHETYMDCPYYEQLMYVGDTRLEVLVNYAMTRDERLPRKAIELFDQSRTPDGLTSARYPTKTTQTIPPFSFWWVAMVHDYMMWRGDRAFLRARVPGVRAVIEALRQRVHEDGLFHPFQGWNFTDWSAHHYGQTPPHAVPAPPFHGPGPSAVHQFHAAYTLTLAAEIEHHLGEETLAARHLVMARRLRSAGHRAYFDHDRSLYRELPIGSAGLSDAASTWSAFTEQTQSMALLSGSVPAGVLPRFASALLSSTDLIPATLYFTHYLFEAYRLLADFGGIDALLNRLSVWHALPSLGLKTTPEKPEPTRSDCHAWGAHPVFHLYATLLGVRPAAPGFARVRVDPRLGTSQNAIDHIGGRLVHPAGTISIETHRSGGKVRTSVQLPPGVAGELVTSGGTTPLHGPEIDPAKPPTPQAE